MLDNKRKTSMIRWKLRVLMAEQNINNKKLAEISGIHPTTISRLKNVDTVKQISSDILNGLCIALQCTPNDLLEFTPDPPKNSEELVDSNNPESFIEFKSPHSSQQHKAIQSGENKRRKYIA